MAIMESDGAPTLDWWQEMVRKREEEELASYVFADRLKLVSMSFQQHDNHLRNAAHYDKLLKSFALKLSKARDIASETLEGLSETERLWVFEIQRMECYESEMAIRKAGIETMKKCLEKYESKEKFNEYALEKVKSYRAAAESLRSKRSPASTSPARPGPITRLPPELIRMILKDCCAEPTIAKAARVCREWNHIAVPVLYNSVDLGEAVELELWVINGTEYRWFREGREKSDARIAPMSLSVRLLHTLSTTPYVRYVRKLSYRGLAPHSKSALERWPDSSTREYYGETNSVNNLMLTKLRKKTINQMIGDAKKVARRLVNLDHLELSGKTDFRVFDAFLGVLKWRPLRQLNLYSINIRACHFDRRDANYSITTLHLQNVIYYFGKDKRRRLGSQEANRLAKIRGTAKIFTLLRKCPNLKELCIIGCEFNMARLLQCEAHLLAKPQINFPNLSYLQVYSAFDTPTLDYDFRTQFHWFLSRHPQIESLDCNAGLLGEVLSKRLPSHTNDSSPSHKARLIHGTSSLLSSPFLAIIPQNLKKIEIDHLCVGADTDHSTEIHEGLQNIKESLPYVFSRMPLLEEFQFTNFPWSKNFLRKCLQALRNSPRLKILQFMELYWDVTLPIIQDVARLSPLLEKVTLECDGMMRVDDEDHDQNEPFDAIKLAQTLYPLRNLRTLSINYAIAPTTPAILTALLPYPPDPRYRSLVRVLERLREKNLDTFNTVRAEYLVVVSDTVQAFAIRFPRLDYLNLAVWESAQCLDGNEITLLRANVGGERKCIGWKQVLPTRGMGRLDVRLKEVENMEDALAVGRDMGHGEGGGGCGI